MAERSSLLLADLPPNTSAAIVEVNDSDPELLRYLGDKGLFPKTEIRVLEVEPFDGPIKFEKNGEACSIGKHVARQIYVRVIESAS
jgi:DtxR family Mn-dependent transcriptional regulator